MLCEGVHDKVACVVAVGEFRIWRQRTKKFLRILDVFAHFTLRFYLSSPILVCYRVLMTNYPQNITNSEYNL